MFHSHSHLFCASFASTKSFDQGTKLCGISGSDANCRSSGSLHHIRHQNWFHLDVRQSSRFLLFTINARGTILSPRREILRGATFFENGADYGMLYPRSSPDEMTIPRSPVGVTCAFDVYLPSPSLTFYDIKPLPQTYHCQRASTDAVTCPHSLPNFVTISLGGVEVRQPRSPTPDLRVWSQCAGLLFILALLIGRRQK